MMKSAIVGGKEGWKERSPEEWEDMCQEFGFEFVDFEAKGRNQYSGVLSSFSFELFEGC